MKRKTTLNEQQQHEEEEEEEEEAQHKNKKHKKHKKHNKTCRRRVWFPLDDNKMELSVAPGACQTQQDLEAAWMSTQQIVQAKHQHAAVARLLLRQYVHGNKQVWLEHLGDVFRTFLEYNNDDDNNDDNNDDSDNNDNNNNNDDDNHENDSENDTDNEVSCVRAVQKALLTMTPPTSSRIANNHQAKDNTNNNELCLLGLEKCTVPIRLYFCTTRRQSLIQNIVHNNISSNKPEDVGALSQRASFPARCMALYVAARLAQEQLQEQPRDPTLLHLSVQTSMVNSSIFI